MFIFGVMLSVLSPNAGIYGPELTPNTNTLRAVPEPAFLRKIGPIAKVFQ